MVYRAFAKHQGEHLTTEEAFRIVHKMDRSVGIATIYRTTQLFEQLGILNTITFDDGIVRYELKDAEAHRHHHLICIQCGHVTEFKLDLLENLEREIEEEEDFKITDHSLKFYGYCKDCYHDIEQGD
ncbi:Fur family transcriptional regulator [Peptoniphilus equinus]|uniref:Fur family transcriptional regulator n=1 Tax=Peptoniphilus equinus TaxID=3016343 RepID=UPI0028BE8728|nr:transcriptional repressor [Peptoniphilus equinus]